MGRWQPGTLGRLQEVALELFSRNGYEATTVADIARGAEVTERTFYRYFSDKREVLFDGQDRLREAMLAGVADAEPDASAVAIAAAALDRVAEFFPDDRRSWSRARQLIIESDPALKERELLKITSLAEALTEALRARGVPELQAGLVGDAAISVFRISFARWISDGEQRSMTTIQTEAFATLRQVASA